MFFLGSNPAMPVAHILICATDSHGSRLLWRPVPRPTHTSLTETGPGSCVSPEEEWSGPNTCHRTSPEKARDSPQPSAFPILSCPGSLTLVEHLELGWAVLLE